MLSAFGTLVGWGTSAGAGAEVLVFICTLYEDSRKIYCVLRKGWLIQYKSHQEIDTTWAPLVRHSLYFILFLRTKILMQSGRLGWRTEGDRAHEAIVVRRIHVQSSSILAWVYLRVADCL